MHESETEERRLWAKQKTRTFPAQKTAATFHDQRIMQKSCAGKKYYKTGADSFFSPCFLTSNPIANTSQSDAILDHECFGSKGIIIIKSHLTFSAVYFKLSKTYLLSVIY